MAIAITWSPVGSDCQCALSHLIYTLVLWRGVLLLSLFKKDGSRLGWNLPKCKVNPREQSLWKADLLWVSNPLLQQGEHHPTLSHGYFGRNAQSNGSGAQGQDSDIPPFNDLFTIFLDERLKFTQGMGRHEGLLMATSAFFLLASHWALRCV